MSELLEQDRVRMHAERQGVEAEAQATEAQLRAACSGVLNSLVSFVESVVSSRIPDTITKEAPITWTVGPFHFNSDKQTVTAGGELLKLQHKQCAILFMLAREPGRLVWWSQIFSFCWADRHLDTQGKLPQNATNKLKSQLGKWGEYVHIQRGFGAMLLTEKPQQINR